MDRDILSYSVFLAFSLIFLYFSFGIQSSVASLASSAVFPRLILTLMAGLASVGLYGAIKKKHPNPLPKIQAPFYFILALVFVFVVAFKYIGFVPSATAFIVIMSVYMSQNRTPKNIAFVLCGAFCATFAVQYLFMNVLYFVLP
ncbi:MAG: tripartite tricarboxylate transporter TctB family protein [Methylobacteriaceae bacterium]|jgi:hypothetical protein|nr:tripartite tricarboxylate transporter TctB family protein [Methylobacteriaceae bacterium]